MFTDLFVVNRVLGYSEKEWTNTRTGERKTIKSFALLLQTSNNHVIAEAADDVAETLKSMDIKVGSRAVVCLSFNVSCSTKDNEDRFFQRVRIEKLFLV